ncbi:hypothetical protein U1Q18_038953 [Sarracenia purpurea var. burkii]
MTRRIRTICPQFPPRETNVSEQINGDTFLLRKQEVRSRLTVPLALLCQSTSQKDQGGTILYGSIIGAAVGEQGLRSPVWASRLLDGEGWVETKGSCGIGGDDYDWISELLGDKVGDTETDDSDDVVLVGGV